MRMRITHKTLEGQEKKTKCQLIGLAPTHVIDKLLDKYIYSILVS